MSNEERMPATGMAAEDQMFGPSADYAKVEKRVMAHYGFDPVADIEAFHKKYGLEYDGKPRVLPEDLQSFRTKFLVEELREYRDSTDLTRALIKNGTITQHVVREELECQLDALVDLVYVALGTAYLHGFDFREAWRRVHAANMAKVRAERKEDSKRGSTFDVVKPAGWTPPSHADLVHDFAEHE